MRVLLVSGLIGCSLGARPDPAPGERAKPPVSGPGTPARSEGANASAALVPAGPGVMAITPDNSKITFVGSIPRTSHPGGFKQFHGTIQLSRSADVSAAKIAVEIDMESVWTNILPLTMHLKGADFFDVKAYPHATFVSTSIQPSPGPGRTHMLTGEFTLHGVTKTITMPAAFLLDDNYLRLDCTFTIRQSDYGMTVAAKKTNDEVPITVAIWVPRP
jgi:polyisoprenoid-binding protein YceI